MVTGFLDLLLEILFGLCGFGDDLVDTACRLVDFGVCFRQG